MSFPWILTAAALPALLVVGSGILLRHAAKGEEGADWGCEAEAARHPAPAARDDP